MSISIVMPTYLQPYTDNKEAVEVKGDTLGGCLDDLIERYPGIEQMLFDGKGKLHTYVGVYINGQDAYPDPLQKKMKDGDEIHAIYIIGGG